MSGVKNEFIAGSDVLPIKLIRLAGFMKRIFLLDNVLCTGFRLMP